MPERYRWLIHEAQSLSQTQILDIPHSLFLDVVESALLSHVPVIQNLLNVAAALRRGGTHDTACVAGRRIVYWLGLSHDL